MKRLTHEDSSSFHYSAPVAQLEQYYDKQFDMIKKGNTDLVTPDLVMLGKALAFIRLVKKRLGLALQTDEASVGVLEEVIDAFTRGVIQDNLFTDENSIAKNMGAYLGLLLIANIGGTWEDTENGMAVRVNGRNAYVDEYVEKRLVGLSHLDVQTFYNSVKSAQ